MQAHDNELIPVEYISFGAWDNHHVEFYFNCSSTLVELEKSNELSFGKYFNIFDYFSESRFCWREKQLSFVLPKDDAEIGLLHNTSDLERTCQYANACQNEYNDFFKIIDLPGVRPTGFVINFTFYVQAERDVHILLTSGPRATRNDNEYEIGISLEQATYENVTFYWFTFKRFSDRWMEWFTISDPTTTTIPRALSNGSTSKNNLTKRIH